MKKYGKILILGDSYSTFRGYLPEGYDTYYSENSSTVNDVSLTWWQKLIDCTDSVLLRNSSFSGTTVCHTGYNGADFREKSFVTRFRKLAESGFFAENKPDTVFVFGGTNDTWAGVPLGELKYSDITEKELYSTFPAFCYLMTDIKKTLPEARIICILNKYLSDEIARGYTSACEELGITYVRPEQLDVDNGHPTPLGMEQIKNCIIQNT